MVGRQYSWVAAVLLVLGGCADRYADLCAEANQCAKGNDADEEGCILHFEWLEERASIYGCDDQWDAYFECFEASNWCDRSSDHGAYLRPKDRCESKYEKLTECCWN